MHSSSHWRAMADAPRDTPVLLKVRAEADLPERGRNFAGIAFVGIHRGDRLGWSFAAPVGMGGIPDDWLEGWCPVHDGAAVALIQSQLDDVLAKVGTFAETLDENGFETLAKTLRFTLGTTTPARAVPVEALAWVTSGDTGMSSQAIWAHMVGVPQEEDLADFPRDPADLGRCVRLLDKVPAWRLRMHEMAAYGPEWAALVRRWDELETLLRSEAGPKINRSKEALKTWDLMIEIRASTKSPAETS